MKRLSRLRVIAAIGAIVAGAALVPAVVPTTSGAFLAKVTNATNTTSTATRFLCRDAFAATALKASAYFEYQFTGNASTAADSGSAGNTGTFQNGHATEAVSTASACPYDNDPSTGTGAYTYTPNGTNQWVSTSKSITAVPTTFSLVIWFRTTAAGGYLLGLNSGQTTDGSTKDRHVYLDTTGHVRFGTYNSGTYQLVTSPLAYNDGKWHQAVATMTPTAGMELWVDGTSVAANSAYKTGEPVSAGYWRVAYGPLGSNWTGAPSSTYFSGALRFAAAYSIQLSQEEIQAEYRNGKPLS